MATTTIRVDRETHRLLVELAEESGRPLIETVRNATEALRRKRLAELAVAQMDALRQDPEAWQAYMREFESTEVTDGIDG